MYICVWGKKDVDRELKLLYENVHAYHDNICLPNGSIRVKSSAANVGMTMNSKTSDDIRKCGDLC